MANLSGRFTMKSAILIMIALTLVTVLCAFPKGTINPGGTISYSSYKFTSDSDATNIITIAPQVGYFVINKLAVDGLVDYLNLSQGDSKQTQFGIGLGARYFFNKLYGGLGLLYSSINFDDGIVDVTTSGNYLELKGGYLLQPARNVYLDLGLKYRMGIGDYGADSEGKNEETILMIGAGLQVFYKTDILGK
jgi:hypothetical protein